MELKKITDKTVPLEVPIDDDVLNVTYRPRALLVRDTFAAERTTEEMTEQAARVIASWDLTVAGQPVPITEEGLANLPLEVVVLVMEKIADAMNPGEANASRSSDGSSGEAS